MNLQKMILGARLSISIFLCHATYSQAADVTLVDAKSAAASVLAAPILAYEEQAATTELKRITDWMTMPASSYVVDQVLSEAKAISSLPNKGIDLNNIRPGVNKAYDLSALAMRKGLPMEGERGDGALKSKGSLYENYTSYFTDPNPGKLGGLNIANILQADAIPEGSIPVDAINLLVDPFPEKLSGVPNRNSSIVDKENFAQKLTNQALLSVSMNALSEMIARRVPAPSENPKSMMQIMRNESETRLKDNQWSTALVGLSQEALLREIAYMQAVQLQMQYQQFRLNEQAVSLLSVIASAQAKFGPMIGDLTKQINQAKTLAR